jgi:hypothetical protein
VKLSETAENPDGDYHIGHTMSKSLDESELSTNIPVAGIVKIIISCRIAHRVGL